jgi:hypothetical protein
VPKHPRDQDTTHGQGQPELRRQRCGEYSWTASPDIGPFRDNADVERLTARFGDLGDGKGNPLGVKEGEDIAPDSDDENKSGDEPIFLRTVKPWPTQHAQHFDLTPTNSLSPLGEGRSPSSFGGGFGVDVTSNDLRDLGALFADEGLSPAGDSQLESIEQVNWVGTSEELPVHLAPQVTAAPGDPTPAAFSFNPTVPLLPGGDPRDSDEEPQLRFEEHRGEHQARAASVIPFEERALTATHNLGQQRYIQELEAQNGRLHHRAVVGEANFNAVTAHLNEAEATVLQQEADWQVATHRFQRRVAFLEYQVNFLSRHIVNNTESAEAVIRTFALDTDSQA